MESTRSAGSMRSARSVGEGNAREPGWWLEHRGEGGICEIGLFLVWVNEKATIRLCNASNLPCIF